MCGGANVAGVLGAVPPGLGLLRSSISICKPQQSEMQSEMQSLASTHHTQLNQLGHVGSPRHALADLRNGRPMAVSGNARWQVRDVLRPVRLDWQVVGAGRWQLRVWNFLRLDAGDPNFLQAWSQMRQRMRQPQMRHANGTDEAKVATRTRCSSK